jgi:hypothetical protein
MYLHSIHVLRNVTGGVRLDKKVKVAGLVVAGNGGIGSDDFFLGAIWLWAAGCDGDMLTDWEAEDRVGRWEFEFVAGLVSKLSRVSNNVANIATLCEILSFSMSSNSWNTSGLRTFCSPGILLAAILRKLGSSVCEMCRVLTHAPDLPS